MLGEPKVGLLNEGILEMSKNSVSSYSLSPYGETKIFNASGTDITATGSAINNTYFFQGRHLDSESGLYYFRNRYYSPDLGRFISRDPLGYDAGDINLYRFVGNNPYGGLDPMGLEIFQLAVYLSNYEGTDFSIQPRSDLHNFNSSLNAIRNKFKELNRLHNNYGLPDVFALGDFSNKEQLVQFLNSGIFNAVISHGFEGERFIHHDASVEELGDAVDLNELDQLAVKNKGLLKLAACYSEKNIILYSLSDSRVSGNAWDSRDEVVSLNDAYKWLISRYKNWLFDVQSEVDAVK
jgi:RHS repeat-associated protein